MSQKSPDVIIYRLSDDTINFKFVDWVGIRKKGWEHTIHHVTPKDIENFVAHIDQVHLKCRYHYLDGNLIVRFPTLAHERAKIQFIDAMITVNEAIAGARFEPITLNGSCDVNLQGGQFQQPDFSCTLTNRHSVNLVVEIAYGQRNSNLVQQLKNYLNQTEGVMVAIGVQIYQPRADHRAAMAIMTFARMAPNMQVATRLISFGTAQLHHAALASFQEQCGIPCTGVGCGGNPCDRDHEMEYTVSIPYNYLLNLDNIGEQLWQMNPNVHIPDYIISLFKLQEDVYKAFQDMRLVPPPE